MSPRTSAHKTDESSTWSPGPVNAKTLLKEAKWVVETVKKSLKENQKNRHLIQEAIS